MVVLSIKKGDQAQFLYETTVNIPSDELIEQLVEISNKKHQLERLVSRKTERN
jgi:hypothetical protein